MDSNRSILPRGLVNWYGERDISVLRLAALLVPMLLVTASEYALFVGATEYVVWGHFATVLVCALVLGRTGVGTGYFVAFALLSTLRLVNFGMPPFTHSPIGWLLLVYLPFLLVVPILTRVRPSVRLTSDWRRTVALLPEVVVIGVALAHVENQILRPEPVIGAWTAPQVALVVLVMIPLVAFVEEVLFRALLQGSLVEEVGRAPGIVLASAFYGLLHSRHGLVEALVFAAVVGLVVGVVYDVTDDLVAATSIHGILNVVLLAYIPHNGAMFAVPYL